MADLPPCDAPDARRRQEEVPRRKAEGKWSNRMTPRVESSRPSSSLGRSLRSSEVPNDRDDTRALRLIHPLRDFLYTEAAGGVVLVLAIGVALVWANVRPTSYEDFWTSTFTIGFADHHLPLTLREWVNDGLMAVFFFVVGLEIKRELVEGELREPRKAALPAIAALGGMAVPALIYRRVQRGRTRAATAGASRWRPTSRSPSACSASSAAVSRRSSSSSCSRSRSSTTSARSS